MYKVLIAEDEMLVRMGLKHSVQWGNYNMSVVADCSDGKAALEAYYEYQPNVVITDIRMPVMNGMDLIRKIRENDNGCAIIILTCIEDLSIAREAMKLDVCSYLLKATMTEEEIGKELQRVTIQLDERSNRYHDINKDMDTMRRDLIRKYVVSRAISTDAFWNEAVHLELDILKNPMVIIWMQLDPYDLNSHIMSGQEGQAVISSIRDMARSKLSQIGETILVGMDEKCSLGFVKLYNNNDLDDILNELNETINRYFELPIVFAVRSSTSGPKRIYSDIMKCKSQLSYTYIFYNCYKIMDYTIQELLDRVETSLTPLINTVRNSINQAKFEQSINSFREMLIKENKFDIDSIKQSLMELMQELCKNFDINPVDTVNVVTSSNNIFELVVLINTLIQEKLDYVLPKTKHHNIQEALSIIHSKYTDSITLQDVSCSVNLSPNYFSSLFKQEVGKSFVSYLNTVRINNAKALLKDTDLYFYEIAEQTGFTDESYFSRIFKRETGLSPSEYRHARGLI